MSENKSFEKKSCQKTSFDDGFRRVEFNPKSFRQKRRKWLRVRN